MTGPSENNLTNGSASSSRAAGFFLTQEYEKALTEYDRLLKQFPGNIVLMTNKARCMLELGNIDEDALSVFMEKIEEVPLETLYLMAEVSYLSGQPDDALFLLDNLIVLEEAYIPAYLLKIEILGETGRGDDILEILQKIYPRFQNDERVLCFAAGYSADFGNMRQANFLFKKALKLNRFYVIQNEQFYDYYLSIEAEKALIPYAKEALTFAPNNKKVLRPLAIAYAMTEKYAAADETFQRLSEQYDVLPDRLKSMWADALMGAKNYEKAFDIARSITPAYEYSDGIFLFLRKMLYFIKAFGNAEAAEERARQWQKEFPNDVGIAHTCAAVLGLKKTQTPPPEYAKEFFDAFSPDFDETLSILGYQGPFLAAKTLDDAKITAEEDWSVLDAGCGTGLLAPSLLPYVGLSGRLVGVDISQRMLDRAREKAQYDLLESADILTYMHAHSKSFDLLASMDVLSYFADLSPVFQAYAKTLKEDGYALFCTLKDREAETDTYALQLSGQYVHKTEYVLTEIKKAGFAVVSHQEHILRYEMGKAVLCLVVLARKKND